MLAAFLCWDAAACPLCMMLSVLLRVFVFDVL